MSPSKLHLESDLSGRSLPGAGRPWSLLGAGLVLVLLVDLLLSALRPLPPPTLADDLASARTALDRVASHSDAWLLVGDSVLAGDVMRATVPRWSEHRVLDYMRREQASDVGFEQIALDGMLPVDVLHVLRELDAVDPAGRVGVVLEINPRFFSTHYADMRGCSREFLCDLGPKPRSPARWAWILGVASESWLWLRQHVPVWRHRAAFEGWSAIHDRLVPRTEAEQSGRPDGVDPLVARARILEHYRGLRVNAGSAQYRALEKVVKRLRARGRRALLFATPLNDDIMAGTLDGARYGQYVAALDELVNRPGDTRVRFASFDHPALGASLFLDHAHLGPEGNRWLAINLLHQLGIGLGTVPPAAMLAYDEGPDRSIFYRIDRGYGEGAPWQAELRLPEGVEVAPGGGRVVIADTGNHCVRELVGPLTTVRTLAGRCRAAGHVDGPRRRARFEAPRLPVLLGDTAWVVDGNERRRLRGIDAETVRTLEPRGERWSRVDAMRGDGRDLWLIDRGTRLLRVTPADGEVIVRYATSGPPLVALDLGPDGRIYLADAQSRLWQLSPEDDEPVLLFANTSPELLPQREGDYFPFDFDEIGLARVVDLRYVDRYDALLVQDEHPGGAHEATVSERVHLRLFSPRERKVYPWVHPIAHGGGYIFRNEHTGALSSNVHRGSMALEPRTATLLWLERDRSRLLALGDGLFGTAKLGHHVTPTRYGGFKDVFGIEAGQSTMLTHHPERWAHRRLEPLPRRGPYLGLLLGSSMTSVTEVVGQYSLGRVMERALVHALGVQDGVRFDLVQRAYRGPRLVRLVVALEDFVEQQAPVDAVFIEVHSGRMFSGLGDDAALLNVVDRIRRAAARSDSLVVILDNETMTATKRDGLRTAGTQLRTFLTLCERAGFVVIRPGDRLLREAIDHAPWGNAPFSGGHGSTWAMDLTGTAFASLAYPRLRRHLRGRVAALSRPRGPAPTPKDPLVAAFGPDTETWEALARDVHPEAMQRHLDGERLQILVDLGKVGVSRALPPEEADELVLAYLVEAIVRDPAGRLVSEVNIQLVRFSNYDEYGVGVLKEAETVDRRTLDRADVTALIARVGDGTPK